MPLTKMKLKVKPEELLQPRVRLEVVGSALTVQEAPEKPLRLAEPLEAQPEAPQPAEKREVEELRKLIERVEAPVGQPAVERAPAAPPAPRIEFERAPEALSTPSAGPTAAPEQPLPSLIEPRGAPARSLAPERAAPALTASIQPGALAPRVLKVRKMWRIPRFRLRDSSRLEGAELPLPPIEGGRPVRTPSGYLVIGDGVVRVYAEREGPWGPLQPLTEYAGTQEIFVRELDGEVHITAGIEGKRYVVELPRELSAAVRLDCQPACIYKLRDEWSVIVPVYHRGG